MSGMPEVQLLRTDHEAALLAFELENRTYFAASVPDRGDAYFAEFSSRHNELLAWQAEGTDYFHVLVADDGAIVGRVNLFEVGGGEASLGFRIAERAAGQGLAAAEYGLTALRASARAENVGSRTVLSRIGFVPTGETVLSGLPGITYRLDLTRYST
jgi:ribosomal-protein-alanine N-acetyltransferase